MSAIITALGEVARERILQNEKWGEQNHPDGTGLPTDRSMADYFASRCQRDATEGMTTWRGILLEEVYEALAEADPVQLRAELVQVAAVAVAWIEALDRRALPVVPS